MQRAEAEQSAQGAGSACWLPCTHTASYPDSAHTVTGEAVTCKCDSTRQPRSNRTAMAPQANDRNRRLKCLLHMALPGLCPPLPGQPLAPKLQNRIPCDKGARKAFQDSEIKESCCDGVH